MDSMVESMLMSELAIVTSMGYHRQRECVYKVDRELTNQDLANLRAKGWVFDIDGDRQGAPSVPQNDILYWENPSGFTIGAYKESTHM